MGRPIVKYSDVKQGDLIRVKENAVDWECDSIGIILSIVSDIEVPPLVEILWDNGCISKIYPDDVEVLSENR